MAEAAAETQPSTQGDGSIGTLQALSTLYLPQFLSITLEAETQILCDSVRCVRDQSVRRNSRRSWKPKEPSRISAEGTLGLTSALVSASAADVDVALGIGVDCHHSILPSTQRAGRRHFEGSTCTGW